MSREILFAGEELELLLALDRAGCVLTDAGHFTCTLDNDKLPFNSRLPVRIVGEYSQDAAGWKITCRVVPAPRTVLLGGIFFLLFLFGLISGGRLPGAVLFGILSAAVMIHFLGQRNSCLKWFERSVCRK